MLVIKVCEKWKMNAIRMCVCVCPNGATPVKREWTLTLNSTRHSTKKNRKTLKTG